MTNYVPINNTIFRDIVRCLNSQYWSRFMHIVRELVWYLTKKSTVLRVIIKVTEKLVIIR